MPGNTLDLCDRCGADLKALLAAFVAAKDFGVAGVVVNDIPIAEPINTDNVSVKP